MNYKIISHNNVCVIALSGNIGRDDRELLLKCVEEVKGAEFNSALVLFKDVDSIETSVYRELTLLQHEIRLKKERLRLIGLKGSLRSVLGEKGVIRGSELIADIKEALQKA